MNFLDKKYVINRHVFVSNICRSTFRRYLLKQPIINVNKMFIKRFGKLYGFTQKF